MESPTYPKLNPMFEQYLTKRLKDYADAEVRTSNAINHRFPDDNRYGDPMDMDIPPDDISVDEESIDDGFSGSGSYLSTVSCPVSPSPTRHRVGSYRPQRPTYDPTRGILKSITEGNNRRLSKLLGSRRSSNAASLEDLTAPLTQAIRLGQDKCAISLLSAGADPNGFDDEGKTPLYLLMEIGGGNPEILRILLKFRASPDLATWNLKHAPLHLAAKKGFQVSVKHLLAANAKPDIKDAGGSTPLMFAAKDGHVNIVRALIKAGADPNVKNLSNESAVHFSVKGGQIDCLKEILELGGDPDERDSRGQTPLILACKGKHTKIGELLLDYECDVNGQDTNTGKTALHWAVQNADINMVTELLDAGADPNIKDKNWANPFMMALTAGKADILDMLLHAGCNVISTDRSGNTALHLAATEGQSHLITSLIEAGVHVDLKGPAGVTSVMLASFRGHVSTVKELLKHGANPNLMDRNRASALMFAILSKESDNNVHAIIKMLIRTNCDLDNCANLAKVLKHLDLSLGDDIQVEERLYSPLEVAYLRGKTAVFMMLITAGADTSMFKGDVMPFVADKRPQEGEQRNKWYMLHCLRKDKEEIKSLRELCRRPALQFMAMQFKGHSKTLAQTITAMPFGDKLKSFLAYGDIDAVENKYNVTLREKQSQSPSVATPTQQIPNPKNANIHSLRSSFRRSSGFTRNSTVRQSLPLGYYNQNGPVASSTPNGNTPTRSSSRTSISSNTSNTNKTPSRTPQRRHSQNYGDSTSFTPLSSYRQRKTSDSQNPRPQTSTLPRPSHKPSQNGVTRSNLGPRTSSSNNLELTRQMENRLQASTPTHQYGSLRPRKVKQASEYERMERAYDDLRNSMIAAGSISDISSSSSSLSDPRQRANKRREKYGTLDPNQMLSSPTPSTDSEVFFNGDTSPRPGNDVLSNKGPLTISQVSSVSSTESTNEENPAKQRSTLKYRNMYNNNLGIPTAMVSPTVAEVNKEPAEEKPAKVKPAGEKVEKRSGEWGLKCLRKERLVKPAPEIITMDDQEKELLENIVRETEEKLKEQKAHIPPDERPMKPMSEETRKAIYDKRWAKIPNPAIIGDVQFSRNGIGSPRTSISEDANTQTPPQPQVTKNQNIQPQTPGISINAESTPPRNDNTQQMNSQNLRSSLRPNGSPTPLEKKGVRFSPSSEKLSKPTPPPIAPKPQNYKSNSKQVDQSSLDDSAIQRWGTMTLDDPAVLDNSENFTSDKSLRSPTGKRTSSRTSSIENNNSNSSQEARTISSTPSPFSSSLPPVQHSPPNRSPRMRPKTEMAPVATRRNAYDFEELDNQSYHSADRRNKNINGEDAPAYPADQDNRNNVPSFSRNSRPYSSLRIRGPHANYIPSHMREDGGHSNSVLDRFSRKRSGMKTKDYPNATDTSLTSPTEKREAWYNDDYENVKHEVKKTTNPGSKIKMAFLRSKSVRK